MWWRSGAEAEGQQDSLVRGEERERELARKEGTTTTKPHLTRREAAAM